MAETELELRSAEEADLPTIVALLVDDPLGARREDASEELASDYRTAFQAIAADDNHDLLVADIEGYVVGCSSCPSSRTSRTKGGGGLRSRASALLKRSDRVELAMPSATRRSRGRREMGVT